MRRTIKYHDTDSAAGESRTHNRSAAQHVTRPPFSIGQLVAEEARQILGQLTFPRVLVAQVQKKPHSEKAPAQRSVPEATAAVRQCAHSGRALGKGGGIHSRKSSVCTVVHARRHAGRVVVRVVRIVVVGVRLRARDRLLEPEQTVALRHPDDGDTNPGPPCALPCGPSRRLCERAARTERPSSPEAAQGGAAHSH